MAGNSKLLEPLAMRVASGQTVKMAAEAVGCSAGRAYHLSNTPEFRQRVAELRTAATDQAVGRLSEAASQAVATLVELLDAANESRDRLNAAKAILGLIGPLSELHELRSRLDKLESDRETLRVIS